MMRRHIRHISHIFQEFFYTKHITRSEARAAVASSVWYITRHLGNRAIKTNDFDNEPDGLKAPTEIRCLLLRQKLFTVIVLVTLGTSEHDLALGPGSVRDLSLPDIVNSLVCFVVFLNPIPLYEY